MVTKRDQSAETFMPPVYSGDVASLVEELKALATHYRSLAQQAEMTEQVLGQVASHTSGEAWKWTAPAETANGAHAGFSSEGCVGCARVTGSAEIPDIPEKDRTTLMLRNLPIQWTREELLVLLDSFGLNSCYDFVYMPQNFKGWHGFGYAFVNFVGHSAALQAKDALHDFCGWESTKHTKALEVAWSHPLQGLDAHVARYRNSPVMSAEVPDCCRPLLFKDGRRVQFPQPTQRLRAPRRFNR